MHADPVPPSLRELVADTLEIDPTEVTPDTSAANNDNWDSFRHLQLILSLEGEYGVQFDPQQVPELTSVAKLQEALTQKGVSL